MENEQELLSDEMLEQVNGGWPVIYAVHSLSRDCVADRKTENRPEQFIRDAEKTLSDLRKYRRKGN